MRKIIYAAFAVSILSGCAALTNARNKAAATLCANKDTLIAVALTNNDLATVKAIEAYCPRTPPR